MVIAADASRIFSPTGRGAWLPKPIARGPFEGMQGGAVAGLMCAEVESVAAARGLGFVSAFTAHFLKPTPMAELTVACQPLRSGRRVSVVDATVSSASGVCAVGRATLIAPVPDDRIPTPSDDRSDPTTHPTDRRSAPHGEPWFMDAMEVRVAEDRTWFRLAHAIREDQGPMTRVLPAADWAHGIHRPMGANAKPVAAIPNPDLTVHLFRAPVGDWIGLDAASAWSSTSIGLGWATLFDVQGRIGQVAMSVAVTMLEG